MSTLVVGAATPETLLLTVAQAARLLGIGTTLAYALIGRGELPHVRLGRAVRVPRRALDEWIAGNTRGAAAPIDVGPSAAFEPVSAALGANDAHRSRPPATRTDPTADGLASRVPLGVTWGGRHRRDGGRTRG